MRGDECPGGRSDTGPSLTAQSVETGDADLLDELGRREGLLDEWPSCGRVGVAGRVEDADVRDSQAIRSASSKASISGITTSVTSS